MSGGQPETDAADQRLGAVAVLIPVKAFSAAKQRLSGVLGSGDRVRFARWMADGVVDAVREMAVFVACDDAEVRDWAEHRGASVIWGAGLGLNGAVDDGVVRIAAAGFDQVVVTHSDLPFPSGLARIARLGTFTLVPDRRRDGTNVMSFPTSNPITASYGAGSFARHLAAATTSGGAVEVRSDAHLSLDIDNPADLAHPLTTQVLPTWLPTIQANRYIHVAT